MSGKTLTRADLCEAVMDELGVHRSDSVNLVEMALDEMSEGLVRDEILKLSSFGTFSVRHKRARTGRNPRTKVEVEITPRRVVSFRASHVLKDKINGNG